MRWTPRRKDFKASIARLTCGVGVLQRDKRMTAVDHLVVARDASLVDCTELRRIRATFSQVMRTLFRLKANCFPLWNWAAGNRSCPHSDCLPGDPAAASHVFFRPVRWRQVAGNTYSYCGGISGAFLTLTNTFGFLRFNCRNARAMHGRRQENLFHPLRTTLRIERNYLRLQQSYGDSWSRQLSALYGQNVDDVWRTQTHRQLSIWRLPGLA
uniref:Uncharacterized protein n=1 Tax=Hyaloperonospora arabidopsidis (strain Emoy2) TaxID=559515 RepID=M4BBT5_HYAAE